MFRKKKLQAFASGLDCTHGFRVFCLGFRVEGLGFRIHGSCCVRNVRKNAFPHTCMFSYISYTLLQFCFLAVFVLRTKIKW